MSTSGQSTLEANNWLALEDHLVQHIKAVVEGLSPAVHVLTAADLADVKEAAQRTPAVHVIYAGYRVTEAVSARARLLHTWYVVAAVRKAATVRSGQAARADIGPLLALVGGSLMGVLLPGATRALELVTPPAPAYSGGYQYVPLAFAVETIFKKT